MEESTSAIETPTPETIKKEEKPKKFKFYRMTNQQMSKLVLDILDGKVFLSCYIRNINDIAMVFMPLALGALSGAPDEYITNVGVIYEYYAKAGPMSMNGMPTFFSCSIVHKDDWNKMLPILDNQAKAKEERESEVADLFDYQESEPVPEPEKLDLSEVEDLFKKE